MYAILTPRKDGVAIDLSARRISQYNAISYNLPYFDKGGIQRAAGDLETWIEIKKGQSEFKQENLLGSCSQGFTSGKAHCVFDENVENGTLVVRFKEPKNKENIAKVYKYTTLWHLQAPDVALGKITSNDERFMYETDVPRTDLVNIAYTLVHEISAAPKLPEGKKVVGKVYNFAIPIAKKFPAGDITISLTDDPPPLVNIALFMEAKNNWELLDTTVNGKKLTAKAPQSGIFSVLSDDK
ncbi:hypothetical protein HYS91_03625 [Candidatus Daviesbacteria bacterium]|nr:hypothetical protein [Candidatus Daviesbacteria bacterium]